MASVMLFDLAITLVGQPATYWRDPGTVEEHNRFMRVVVSQGWLPCILLGLLYIAASTAHPECRTLIYADLR